MTQISQIIFISCLDHAWRNYTFCFRACRLLWRECVSNVYETFRKRGTCDDNRFPAHFLSDFYLACQLFRPPLDFRCAPILRRDRIGTRLTWDIHFGANALPMRVFAEFGKFVAVGTRYATLLALSFCLASHSSCILPILTYWYRGAARETAKCWVLMVIR